MVQQWWRWLRKKGALSRKGNEGVMGHAQRLNRVCMLLSQLNFTSCFHVFSNHSQLFPPVPVFPLDTSCAHYCMLGSYGI
eukprot:1160669-Pelagomonas_calceolata.AAC.5